MEFYTEPQRHMGSFGKMACPSIANVRYVTSFSNQISVFGLTNNNSCNNPNVAILQTIVWLHTALLQSNANAANAFDNNTGTAWTGTNGDGDGATITVNLGATYTICKVILHWGANFGKDFLNIQVLLTVQLLLTFHL